MKNIGLVLAAALIGTATLSSPSFARGRDHGVRGRDHDARIQGQDVLINREPRPDPLHTAPFYGNG
jgi:hypothetical protein